jgi:hypothetical protein
MRLSGGAIAINSIKAVVPPETMSRRRVFFRGFALRKEMGSSRFC